MQERNPSGGTHSAEHDLELVNALVPPLHDELCRVARGAHLRLCGKETRGTSEVLHQAYSWLIAAPGVDSHGHFLRVVATAMHRVLIDHVRTQRAARRGADRESSPFGEIDDFTIDDDAAVLAIHDALEGLSAADTSLFDVAECRIFAGYSAPETAEALGVSVKAVRHDWAVARAWLRTEMAS